MHNIDLILTLTGGLTFALILGYITHRMGLSPIVGYLLAGVVVSEYTPGFVANRGLAEQLAEVGVILLMFGVGLQFHIKELLAVRRIAIPGAIVQSVAATVLGAILCALAGWGWTAGLVYGLAISVASTVVLTRVLADHNDLHTQRGHIAVGWLVVEDLFTVLVLVLLPALFPLVVAGAAGEAHPQSPSVNVWLALVLALVKIGLLVAFTFIIGGRVIPWLLAKVTATRSRELFTLTVLVLALGIAVGSAKLFGASMALGAFLAGMVVGRSEFSLRAASEALPMRDAFAVLFFVSVGMLFDPMHLVREPLFVLATLAVVMIGKPLAAFTIVAIMRYPVKTSLAVAIALAQIGEFSFILATMGIRQLAILPEAAMNSLVAAAILSITLNPLLYSALGPIEAWMSRRPRLWRLVNRVDARAESEGQGADAAHDAARRDHLDAGHRAVVIGYGPVGQTVARLLRDNGVEPAIVELNLDTVRRLRGEGVVAVYGDAAHRDTLTAAGIDRANTLIISTPSHANTPEVIRLARELNPRVRVLARSAYLRELPDLRHAGASSAFSGEGEVAMAMTEAVLRHVGATADQIDRERDRVRQELLAPLVVVSTPQPPADPPATEPGPPAQT
jgi:CPA2 family monovalent cation:H+ antiporter-2